MNLTNFLVKWLQSNSRSKNATKPMKGGETLRETHPPLWLLIGRININFFICGKQKAQYFRSRLDLSQFFRVKNIVGFSDWPELIFVRKFTLIPYERRGNFARNSPTVMAFDWTYQYQFLYMWKTKSPIFSIPIRLVTVFSCEKHCWLLWLARTHFRTKIYDKTFK